jgi:hypothetical protein
MAAFLGWGEESGEATANRLGRQALLWVAKEFRDGNRNGLRHAMGGEHRKNKLSRKIVRRVTGAKVMISEYRSL